MFSITFKVTNKLNNPHQPVLVNVWYANKIEEARSLKSRAAQFGGYDVRIDDLTCLWLGPESEVA